jgi:hypothetical protein
VPPWSPEDLQQLYGAAAQAIATAEELIRASEQLISGNACARASGPGRASDRTVKRRSEGEEADSAAVAGAPAARPTA